MLNANRVASLLGLLALALPLASWAAAPAGVDDYAMKAVRVADGVYGVPSPARDFPNPENKGWNANLAFVVTPEGVLVVDTGSSETIGKALLKTIRSVTDKPVKWVVNTHSHGDHWLGNAAFAGAKPQIISSQEVKKRISSDGQRWVDLFDRMTEGATGRSRILPPNHPVDARVRQSFGGVPVEFIASGNSHSPGDVVVWLPRQRVLMSGDVVYSDRAPSLFDANVGQWIRFLGELQALKAAVVIPGHGKLSDASAIRQLRGYMVGLHEVVKQGYDAGLTDYEIVPHARQRLAGMASYFQGFDDKLGRSVNEMYLYVERESLGDV